MTIQSSLAKFWQTTVDTWQNAPGRPESIAEYTRRRKRADDAKFFDSLVKSGRTDLMLQFVSKKIKAWAATIDDKTTLYDLMNSGDELASETGVLVALEIQDKDKKTIATFPLHHRRYDK